MRAPLVVGVLMFAGVTNARAETVGVVIAGDATPVPALRGRIEHWLAAHDHRSERGSLTEDAGLTLANCFEIDDIRKCAAGVVAARAKTDAILFVRNEPNKLALTWLLKGHSPATQLRACNPCSDNDLYDMLGQLAAAAPLDTGFLRLRSKPPGLDASIDGAIAGPTPLERDLPIGEHAIALVDHGEHVADRTITVETGQEVDLVLAPRARKWGKWPLAMMAAGAGVMLLGGVLVVTSESPTGAHPTYRNTEPLGIGFVVIGGATAAAGGIIGWTGAF